MTIALSISLSDNKKMKNEFSPKISAKIAMRFPTSRNTLDLISSQSSVPMAVVLIAFKSPLLSQVTAFQLIAVKRLAGKNIPYGWTF